MRPVGPQSCCGPSERLCRAHAQLSHEGEGRWAHSPAPLPRLWGWPGGLVCRPSQLLWQKQPVGGHVGARRKSQCVWSCLPKPRGPHGGARPVLLQWGWRGKHALVCKRNRKQMSFPFIWLKMLLKEVWSQPASFNSFLPAPSCHRLWFSSEVPVAIFVWFGLYGCVYQKSQLPTLQSLHIIMGKLVRDLKWGERVVS